MKRGVIRFRDWFDNKLLPPDPFAGWKPHELLSKKPDIFLRRVKERWGEVSWESFIQLETREEERYSGLINFENYHLPKLMQEISNILDKFEMWWASLPVRERNFCNAVRNYVWTWKNNQNPELRKLMKQFSDYKNNVVNGVVCYYFAEAKDANVHVTNEKILEQLGFEKCRLCKQNSEVLSADDIVDF